MAGRGSRESALLLEAPLRYLGGRVTVARHSSQQIFATAVFANFGKALPALCCPKNTEVRDRWIGTKAFDTPHNCTSF